MRDRSKKKKEEKKENEKNIEMRYLMVQERQRGPAGICLPA